MKAETCTGRRELGKGARRRRGSGSSLEVLSARGVTAQVPFGSQVARSGGVEVAGRGGSLELGSGGRETRLRAQSRFLLGERQLGRHY